MQTTRRNSQTASTRNSTSSIRTTSPSPARASKPSAGSTRPARLASASSGDDQPHLLANGPLAKHHSLQLSEEEWRLIRQKAQAGEIQFTDEQIIEDIHAR